VPPQDEYRRPRDDEYWARPWSRILFSGDVFDAIPFGMPPTEIVVREDVEPVQHYTGQVGFAYGLLISPTCDMYEAVGAEPRLAHPFRVLVPVLDLAEVVRQTETVERSVGLLRSRDSLTAYMYLPALPGFFEESVACLFRPAVVADDFLADPPRRIAQMTQEGRRHLKIKLAAYWGRVKVDPDAIPLGERNADETRTDGWPPSRYDSGQGIAV
jgi:hypothetical protein